MIANSLTSAAMTDQKKILSKDDWEYIAVEARSLFGTIKIKFDEYEVIYSLQHISATKGHIMTYVNGVFSGVWINKKNECPEQQFLRLRKLPCYKPKEKEKIIKDFGKRAAKKYFPHLDGYVELFDGTWPSWAPVLRHIKRIARTFTHVELIREL